jgi:hypothetical protein
VAIGNGTLEILVRYTTRLLFTPVSTPSMTPVATSAIGGILPRLESFAISDEDFEIEVI